jgi:hypothetical protein
MGGLGLLLLVMAAPGAGRSAGDAGARLQPSTTTTRPCAISSPLPTTVTWSFSSGLRGLRRELEQLDLAERRRVAFYPLGAAWALLLDQTRPDWKRIYARQPFTLPDLISLGR